MSRDQEGSPTLKIPPARLSCERKQLLNEENPVTWHPPLRQNGGERRVVGLPPLLKAMEGCSAAKCAQMRRGGWCSCTTCDHACLSPQEADLAPKCLLIGMDINYATKKIGYCITRLLVNIFSQVNEHIIHSFDIAQWNKLPCLKKGISWKKEKEKVVLFLVSCHWR